AELVGAVDPVAITTLLHRMDVAVAPYPASATYFSPLKLYEYLAAGLPVVASRVGQIPDVIEDGRTGRLCPPEDPCALAEAVLGLRKDPEAAAALAAAGRAMVERDHTWLAVADRILQMAGAPVPAKD
ncbi:MAG TPA: glycosyltransferase, partial [Acidimicrobiales bacterium]|nr:glycosyltransferase [Acidimicrobiales bacterium]